VDYAALKTAVEDYTENTFSATDFATMTKLAEQRIYNSVQLPALRKNVTGTLTQGNQYLAAPTDFLSVFSIAVIDGSGNYEYLLNKDVNFIRSAFPNPSTQGTPKYYALFGPVSNNPDELTLILGPTPSAALSAELHYFYYPESIVTATNTWLSDNFDSVLFNAVMVEAARFMKQEQDIVGEVDKQFMQSLSLLKNLGDGKNRQDAYRSGQVRTQVI
tara:strand:+ start:558 stop:1208 length:651 start_codon:yes stop_codon:yes gene_type:complete